MPSADQALRDALGLCTGLGLVSHKSVITTAAFSSDSRRLVTGSLDGTARLWDLSAPVSNREPVVLTGHTNFINALALSPDGRWLGTGSDDSTASLWDLFKSDPCGSGRELRHGDWGAAVTALAFSPDGRWLVTASDDARLRLWDMRLPTPELRTVLEGHESVSVMRREPLYDEFHAWRLEGAGTGAKPVVLGGHGDSLRASAMSDNGRWIVLSGPDATVVWELVADRFPREAIRLGPVKSKILAVSNDGCFLAFEGNDRDVCLQDLTGTEVERKALVIPGSIMPLSGLLSPDNRWLVMVGKNRFAGDAVRLWDLTADDPAGSRRTLSGRHINNVHEDVNFGSRWLFTASLETGLLWDLTAEDPAEAPAVLRGHEDWIVAVARSRDQRWLATGSRDGTARVWDLSEESPGGTSIVLHGHERAVEAVAISTDSRLVATGSSDNTVRLWALHAEDLLDDAAFVVGRNLTPAEWERYFQEEPYRFTFPTLPAGWSSR